MGSPVGCDIAVILMGAALLLGTGTRSVGDLTRPLIMLAMACLVAAMSAAAAGAGWTLLVVCVLAAGAFLGTWNRGVTTGPGESGPGGAREGDPT